jgi:hypothetical protein
VSCANVAINVFSTTGFNMVAKLSSVHLQKSEYPQSARKTSIYSNFSQEYKNKTLSSLYSTLRHPPSSQRIHRVP